MVSELVHVGYLIAREGHDGEGCYVSWLILADPGIARLEEPVDARVILVMLVGQQGGLLMTIKGYRGYIIANNLSS